MSVCPALTFSNLCTTPDGHRVYEEFDTSSSNRGPGHRDRILANDPSGEVNLFTVD